MLSKLTVRNFKRFREETSIDFAPITVLLGANNSGKSTVLQALSIFQYCMDVTRKKKNDGFTLETRTIGPEEFGVLPVTSPTDLWPNGQPKGAIDIRAEFHNGASVGFEIKLSYNRFSVSPHLEGDVLEAIDQAKIRYVPIHSGLAVREEYLLAPARADRLRELQHGSVIRNLLWDLKENDKPRWKLLRDILKRLYPAASIDVLFDKEVDRFISSEYEDDVLGRSLDVLVAGTGFQQVLQIFSGVLSQGSSIVLMDEPDAHLHARLQAELMRVFEDLAKNEGLQFILATHSPHLLAASPPGSLRAMIEGKAHPFAATPEQMDVLDTLGAFDRMEIIPLLRTKAVVFVENRDDREYLEMFARKLWGEAKTRRVWEGLSFLFTYQDPITADVKRLARQVKDLLNAETLRTLAGGRQARFLVLGDRDYRSMDSIKRARKELLKDAKGPDFKLDLRCVIWNRNEIENYLLDPAAMEAAVVSSLSDSSRAAAAKEAVRDATKKGLSDLKAQAQTQIAARLQQDDPKYRGDYVKATREANRILDAEWGDGFELCDAKKLLAQVRTELQNRRIRARLSEASAIGCLSAVPGDVQSVLNMLYRHSAGSKTGRVRSKSSGPVR